MLTKDIEATIAAQFEDPDSRITLDGREILKGRDWAARSYMVWCRGNGRCEHPGCRSMMMEPHHIIRRSKGRDDRMANLVGLCHHHHSLLDPRRPMWSKQSSAE